MSGELLAGNRWINYQNRSRETVPPFGVLRISGGRTSANESPYLWCDRPDNYGSIAATVVNGAVAVAPQAYGGCTRLWPAFAAFHEADGEPQPGETWGPVEDSFKLRKYAPGFLVIGEPQLDGENRGVLVLPDFTSLLRVRLDADLDPGEEVQATILRFDAEASDPENPWATTELKKTVRQWGTRETIDQTTDCTAEPRDGKWWVVPVEC